MVKDVFLTDFSDPAIETAFHAYLKEMGVPNEKADAVFSEMIKSSEMPNIHTLARFSEDGEVIGFIQFQIDTLTNWFFEETFGLVRDFWTSSKMRGQGHGAALLALCETYFSEHGIRKVILNTHSAAGFYCSHGYVRDESYRAKNGEAVFVKMLS